MSFYGADEPVDVELDPASAAMEELILRATDELMVYFSTYECVNHSHGGRCAVRSPLCYPQMSTDWTLNLAICDKITTTPTRFNRQSYLHLRASILNNTSSHCKLLPSVPDDDHSYYSTRYFSRTTSLKSVAIIP